jgi:hypothetical protein
VPVPDTTPQCTDRSVAPAVGIDERECAGRRGQAGHVRRNLRLTRRRRRRRTLLGHGDSVHRLAHRPVDLQLEEVPFELFQLPVVLRGVVVLTQLLAQGPSAPNQDKQRRQKPPPPPPPSQISQPSCPPFHAAPRPPSRAGGRTGAAASWHAPAPSRLSLAATWRSAPTHTASASIRADRVRCACRGPQDEGTGNGISVTFSLRAAAGSIRAPSSR